MQSTHECKNQNPHVTKQNVFIHLHFTLARLAKRVEIKYAIQNTLILTATDIKFIIFKAILLNKQHRQELVH